MLSLGHEKYLPLSGINWFLHKITINQKYLSNKAQDVSEYLVLLSFHDTRTAYHSFFFAKLIGGSLLFSHFFVHCRRNLLRPKDRARKCEELPMDFFSYSTRQVEKLTRNMYSAYSV